MNILKPLLVIATGSIFAIACNNTSNSSNQVANANLPPRTTPTSPPSAATPAATPDEFAAIRATYSATCIRCHKANGEGGVAELDKGETLKVPSFKEGHALKHTDQQYVRQITKGGEGMPAFGTRLTPEQINELVRFIRREFQGQTSTTGAAASDAKPAAHK